MNFSAFGDSPENREFTLEVRRFLAASLTEEVRARLNATRDEHDPEFFRDLGRWGWIMPHWPVYAGGAALSAEQTHILNSEMERVEAPMANLSPTRLVLPAVAKHGSKELVDEVMPDVTSGRAAISLGYTEAEGGSDIAAVKTSAVRDGEEWVISGAKLFTTGAHFCRYSFLLTMTDPLAPKRQGLTMFLIPLESKGVEVQALRTMGERTNIVYYSDVRISDRYRVGPVNGGWSVLQEPLAAEHDAGQEDAVLKIGGGTMYVRRLALALDAAIRWAGRPVSLGGRRPIDDPKIVSRLARVALDIEVAASVPGLGGRVVAADSFIRCTADLTDLVGPDGLDAATDADAASIAQWHRRAQVASIYGGSVEVFRNLIARELGLPAQRYAEH